MKTNFNIAWVDDNFSDAQMQSSKDQLTRKLVRKNGFSLRADDIFGMSNSGNFEEILDGLKAVVDTSNSIDLALIDYELSEIKDEAGNLLEGKVIAKKFRDSLPTLDIIFYSGKKSAQELRAILAEMNVDCVNCIGRGPLVNDAYTVIENVINRSCRISTLRGLVLNSVCEMDNMIVETLCKFSEADAAQKEAVKDKAVRLIDKRSTYWENLKLKSVEDLLQDKNMMSGRLFSILDDIKTDLGLSAEQLSILGVYRVEILDLRTSAAHAKEAVCSTTEQPMLQFKAKEYKRGDIDSICKIIVKHENNIQSILEAMV
jgi:hypothetical protein